MYTTIVNVETAIFSGTLQAKYSQIIVLRETVPNPVPNDVMLWNVPFRHCTSHKTCI